MSCEHGWRNEIDCDVCRPRSCTVHDDVMRQRSAANRVHQALLEAIGKSGERDIAIVLAGITETLMSVNKWNLEAERTAAREGGQPAELVLVEPKNP